MQGVDRAEPSDERVRHAPREQDVLVYSRKDCCGAGRAARRAMCRCEVGGSADRTNVRAVRISWAAIRFYFNDYVRHLQWEQALPTERSDLCLHTQYELRRYYIHQHTNNVQTHRVRYYTTFGLAI